MPTNRNVIDFKIHNLTEEQFQELKDAGQIDPNALYCTPDETVVKFEELGERINTANERIDTKQDVATAINYGHVTNCITEIPQDIQLELANGVLTLKAGSKVYVPNGAGVFDTEIVSVDIPLSLSANNTYMLFKQQGQDAIDFVPKNRTYSGATMTYENDNIMWYDTESNSCGLYLYDGKQTLNFARNESLPICIFTVSNGAISSIDQVFNGFGYIGSTVFALPGVKGLIPDGRNIDGTLKNTAFTLNKVLTYTSGNYTYTDAIMAYKENSLGLIAKENWYYNQNYNICYQNYMEIGRVDAENGKITAFQPKTTFHAVDYNDLFSGLTTYSPAGMVSAFAGKTAPSGWLKCDGSAISRTLYADLFAAIGTQYGAGDGSTTFNLPTQSVLPLGSEAPVAIYGNGNSLTLISKDNTPVTLLGGLRNAEYQGYAGVGAYTGITTPGTPQVPINPGVDNSTLGLSTDPTTSGISGRVVLTQATGAQAIACIKY